MSTTAPQPPPAAPTAATTGATALAAATAATTTAGGLVAAPPLVAATILAKERLIAAVAAAVAFAWRSLGHYNRAQVDQFLRAVLPITSAANRQSVLLTQAFLARATGTQPAAIDPAQVIAGIRNGTTPGEVYYRSFVTVWGALARDTPWEQAVKLGLERSVSAASTDVQLAYTHTLRAVGETNDRIVGYQRVPDANACAFCRACAGQRYTTDYLMPLHNNCRCGVEVITSSERHLFTGNPANDLNIPGPDGLMVAVREHGELGPLLTNAADVFTDEAQAGVMTFSHRTSRAEALAHIH